MVRERPPLSKALFVVLSADQTKLLAAYDGEADLQVLYQFPTGLYRAQVTFYPADFPVISSDGVWVTVVEEHGESYSCLKHVYVMDSDGYNVKRLTSTAADRCFLTWSPNGTQLAYREVCDPTASLPPQAYVVTLEPYNTPKQVTQITASGSVGLYGQATWSPSGEWLQWAVHRPGVSGGYRLSRLDAEGRVVDEIPLGFGEDILNGGVWSPDSRKLAGVTRDNVLTIWNIESNEVTSVQLQDVRPSQPLKWLQDGKRFVFHNSSNRWYMMDIDGTNLVEFNAP